MGRKNRLAPLNWAIYVLSILVLTACEDESGTTLPNHSGRPGEIIVVCSKAQWNGTLGDSIRQVFQKAQYGLPQSEPYFNVIRTSRDNLETVFKTFRNILVVQIDPNRKTRADLDIKRNVWARGQLVVELRSSDETEALDLLSDKKATLINYFNNKELDRLYLRNKRKGDPKLAKQLWDDYSIQLAPQEDVYIASQDSNVVWLRIERERSVGGFQHQISQGVLVYYYEYEDRLQFLDTNLLGQMDTMLARYVPGPVESSYMSLEYRYVPPTSLEFDYRGHYAKEFRGLWRMNGYAMGGPFTALCTLDEERNRIVCAIGYVYAPQFDKREFLRETDAMIKSIDFKQATKKPASSKEKAG